MLKNCFQFALFLNLIYVCIGLFQFPHSELVALWSLYNNTGGQYWNWKLTEIAGSKWNFLVPDPNPCQDGWQGVTCNSDCTISTCAVTSLKLINYGLTGQLPTDLERLTQLQDLYLSSNNMTGTIPPLGTLAQLENLYLDNNELNGTISPSIGSLSLLKTIYLFNNFLSGSIPSTIGELSLLQNLDLSNNLLTKAIPSELGNLSAVQEFVLSYNQLTETIPSQLNGLSHLTVLDLNNNRLTGTIPGILGNLSTLEEINLSANRLNGTIPPEIVKLSSLEIFNLFGNKLTGPIPSDIGMIAGLKQLDLSGNKLTGEMPSKFAPFSIMEIFILSFNQLNGTIPIALGGLPLVEILDFNRNYLTGTIPHVLGFLPALQILDLSFNRLNGTIPDDLGKLDKLTYLDLTENDLIGTLSTSLCGLVQIEKISLAGNHFHGDISVFNCIFVFLASLNLQNNNFTGSVPSIFHLTSIVQLQLQNNQLTGEVTLNMPKLVNVDISNNKFQGHLNWQNISRSIQYLNLSFNAFSGQIPSNFPAMIGALVSIDLSNNSFTGSFGNRFNRLVQLQLLSLSGNQFTGSLDSLIDPCAQLQLQFLDASNNLLTGTLPGSLFTLPKISTVVVTGNCMKSTLPNTVCDAHNLTTLVLDGMGCSDACLQPLYANVPGSNLKIYVLPQSLPFPTFPACLLSNLPRLQTLHLSGLGLAGTLPAVSSLPTTLEYLSLSYNHLSGTIPDVYWSHRQWKEFDVSFNRIHGHLSTSTNFAAASTAQLRLLECRLSGQLSSSIIHMDNVNVLSGNLFACPLSSRSDRGNPDSDLPSHDPNERSYQCGSNDVDVSLYIWFGCILLVVILLVIYVRWILQEEMWTLSMVWMNKLNLSLIKGNNSTAFNNVADSVTMIEWQRDFVLIWYWARFPGLLMCISLFVLTPIYIILKIWYATYNDQYAWTLSASYLSGIAPSVILAILFSGCLILYLFTMIQSYRAYFPISSRRSCLQWFASSKQPQSPSSVPTLIAQSTQITTTWGCSGISVQLAGMALISASVVVVINGLYVYVLNQHVHTEYLFLLSWALSLFKLLSNALLLHTSSTLTSVRSTVSVRAAFDTLMTMTNQKTTDVLIVLLCFNNVVVPYLAESLVSTNCFYYATFAASPVVSSTVTITNCRLAINPYIYNFEFSLPEYTTVCLPTLQTVSYQPPFMYSYSCSSSLIANFGGVFVVRYLLSGVILPCLTWTISYWVRILSCTRRQSTLIFKLLEKMELGRWRIVRLVQEMQAQPQGVDLLLNSISVPQVYDHRHVAATLVTDLLMLLTFGILFPPLSVVIFLSMIVYLMDHHMALQSLQDVASANTSTTDVWQQWLARLHVEIQQTYAYLLRPMWAVAQLTALFWSFTLFDTLGDVVGALAASGIVIAMSVMPGFIYLCLWFWTEGFHQKQSNNSPKETTDHARSTVHHNPILAFRTSEVEIPGYIAASYKKTQSHRNEMISEKEEDAPVV